MGGHHLTIGDISIFYEFGLFVVLFNFDLTHYPKLQGWFNRVSTHPIVVDNWASYSAWVRENVVSKTSAPAEDTFDLYFFSASQPSMAVKTLLEICGAKFNIHNVSLPDGEQRHEKYLEKSPLGLVPCLVHNGYSMVESASILRFLSLKYHLKNLYPENLSERHAIDLALDYNGNTLRRQCDGCSMGIVFNPIFGGRTATRDEKKKYLADAHSALQKFND